MLVIATDVRSGDQVFRGRLKRLPRVGELLRVSRVAYSVEKVEHIAAPMAWLPFFTIHEVLLLVRERFP